ncbi:unnamed protein product [Sphagnum balticum]
MEPMLQTEYARSATSNAPLVLGQPPTASPVPMASFSTREVAATAHLVFKEPFPPTGPVLSNALRISSIFKEYALLALPAATAASTIRPTVCLALRDTYSLAPYARRGVSPANTLIPLSTGVFPVIRVAPLARESSSAPLVIILLSLLEAASVPPAPTLARLATERALVPHALVDSTSSKVNANNPALLAPLPIMECAIAILELSQTGSV